MSGDIKECCLVHDAAGRSSSVSFAGRQRSRQRYVVLAGPVNRLRSAFSRSLNLSFPRKEAMRRIMLRAASGPGGHADRPGKSGRAWSGGAVQPA